MKNYKRSAERLDLSIQTEGEENFTKSNMRFPADSDSDIVIMDMTFEDGGEQYIPEHLLPYVISMEG